MGYGIICVNIYIAIEREVYESYGVSGRSDKHAKTIHG